MLRGFFAIIAPLLLVLFILRGSDAQVTRPVARQAPPPDVPRFTPLDAVKIAYEDAAAVATAEDPRMQPRYIRYLSSHNLNSADRLKMKQTVDFTVNSLSTKRIIVRTAGLPNNVPDPVVIRVNLKDYNIDPAAWDSLAQNGSGQVPIPEPYFHQLLHDDELVDEEKTVTGYEDRWVEKDNHHYRERVPVEHKVKTGKKIRSDKKKFVQAAAAWLAYQDGGKLIGDFIALTQTANPILRSDWFVTYGWWAPQYYVLLGLDPDKGTDADFDRLVRLDKKLALPSQIGSITDTKVVALHNRILLRYQTVNGYTGGYTWYSKDTEKGIDDEDYLDNIVTFDHPQIAAQEIIGTLLNTLQAYCLTDGNGKLINAAKASIAVHSNVEPTKLTDKQVYAGRNCVFCHKEGMYPIKCKFRSISQRKIANFVINNFKDHKLNEALADKINDAFQPRVEDVIKHDQSIYSTAVKACNELPPGVNATQLEESIWKYYEGPIAIERLAWDVGWSPAKLDAALRLGVNLHYTLTGLLQEPPERPDILAWERQGFQSLELYLIGLEVEAAKKGMSLDKLLEPHVKK